MLYCKETYLVTFFVFQGEGIFVVAKKTKPTGYEQVATRVALVTIFWNVVLSAGKLLAGIFAHSGAMISDAVHSASDVLSSIIVIIGVRIASQASDREHPYGHERMECVASIILSTVLCITGLAIGAGACKNIFSGDYANLMVPGRAALFAALISILVKETMFWYTRGYAKKLDSGALLADAWHHRSDALSSVGALVGIGGARLGYPILDSVASVVITVFIIKAAYDIFMDAIDKMVDKACDEQTEADLRSCAQSISGVERIDLLMTRVFGNKIYVDIEIAVDGNKTLLAAHSIAEAVHDSIEQQFPRVKHIMVHVNPV
jgi:cation diffusion facilitator family transporter